MNERVYISSLRLKSLFLFLLPPLRSTPAFYCGLQVFFSYCSRLCLRRGEFARCVCGRVELSLLGLSRQAEGHPCSSFRLLSSLAPTHPSSARSLSSQ